MRADRADVPYAGKSQSAEVDRTCSREPAMVGVLARMHSSQGSLQEVVSILTKRLDVVLRQSPMAGKMSDEKQSFPALLEEIEQNTFSTNEAVDTLRSIIERLEL